MHPDKPVVFPHVYAVTQSIHDGKEEYSIAIRPRIEPDNRILWEDNGGRGRVVDFRKWSDLAINWQTYLANPAWVPRRFTLIDRDHDSSYTLESLTLDIYNRKFKAMVAKSPTFNSDAEVQQFFLNALFG